VEELRDISRVVGGFGLEEPGVSELMGSLTVAESLVFCLLREGGARFLFATRWSASSRARRLETVPVCERVWGRREGKASALDDAASGACSALPDPGVS